MATGLSGHICRRTDSQWEERCLSGGRDFARMAEERNLWRDVGEACVKQQTSLGWWWWPWTQPYTHTRTHTLEASYSFDLNTWGLLHVLTKKKHKVVSKDYHHNNTSIALLVCEFYTYSMVEGLNLRPQLALTRLSDFYPFVFRQKADNRFYVAIITLSKCFLGCNLLLSGKCDTYFRPPDSNIERSVLGR